MQEIRTGTMGWSYDDWKGPFYAAGTAAPRLLEEYAKIFSTVELDSTFYGVPRSSTLDGWAAQTPSGFLFSAKAPRAITHERRLVSAAEAALDFGCLLRDHLGPKLGGLLLQLPPDFSPEEKPTLRAFLDGILSRRGGREPLPWVIEFRDGSWAGTTTAQELAERGVACATTERVDLGGPLRYVRLLGTENSVARFDERQMDRSEEVTAWAARLDQARRAVPDSEPPLLVYVRNFFEGHAPGTIALLRDGLGLPNALPPGQQQMSLF
ncbi:MAG: DUF72 domain-containing protein [Cytophagales bacterium]|nr:DUF72 domain-containing protein [Armatimonadota bacterium]